MKRQTHTRAAFIRKESLYKNISVEKKNGIRNCVNIQEKDLWMKKAKENILNKRIFYGDEGSGRSECLNLFSI